MRAVNQRLPSCPIVPSCRTKDVTMEVTVPTVVKSCGVGAAVGVGATRGDVLQPISKSILNAIRSNERREDLDARRA